MKSTKNVIANSMTKILRHVIYSINNSCQPCLIRVQYTRDNLSFRAHGFSFLNSSTNPTKRVQSI